MANSLPVGIAQAARTPPVPVETLAVRTGQVVEARVVGAGQGGTTQLAIGNQLVEAALSVPIQTGVLIQLLVQGAGSNTRLTVLTNPPQGQTPQIVSPAPGDSPPASAPQEQVRGGTASPRPVASSAVIASRPDTVPQGRVQIPSGAIPRAAPPGIASNAVQAPPLTIVASGRIAPGQIAPGQGTAVQAPPLTVLASGKIAPGQIAPGQGTAAQAPPLTVLAPGKIAPGQGIAVQGGSPPPPTNVQPGGVLVSGKITPGQIAPGQGTAVQGGPPPPTPTNVQPGAGTQIEPGTVLRFQVQGSGANARPVLVPVTPPERANTASPSQSPAQPVLPALVPNPLAQAVAQTVRNAVVRQDTITSLLTHLAGLGARFTELPKPVAKAGAKLLAGQLNLSAKPVDGAGLKEAILRSGILFENTLLKGGAQASPQGDLKSALLNFRNALRAWLGGDAQPAPRNEQRPPPPTSGAHPRAAPPGSPASATVIPNAEAGARLLGQAEAVLARLRLTQISSLPDVAGRPAQGPASELNLELPLLLGGELGIGQFQISRDGGKTGGKDRDGEWKMRFSINFSRTGEVGATVSLRGGKTGVMLWAEREETASVLQERQGELADSLAARGLEPGAIRCRHGHPPQAKKPVGAFMDNCS